MRVLHGSEVPPQLMDGAPGDGTPRDELVDESACLVRMPSGADEAAVRALLGRHGCEVAARDTARSALGEPIVVMRVLRTDGANVLRALRSHLHTPRISV